MVSLRETQGLVLALLSGPYILTSAISQGNKKVKLSECYIIY